MSFATLDIFFFAGAFGLVALSTVGLALVATQQRLLLHRGPRVGARARA